MHASTGTPTRIEPLTLPEFGVDLNWAMCRNPMCPNFGRDLAVEIPPGGRQASDRWHRFRMTALKTGQRVGKIKCLACGQEASLPSNRALRPVARYFLSLSLPFADCPDPDCPHHGVNLFENWANTGSGSSRFYRRHRGSTTVRCRHCGGAFSLGTALSVPAERRVKRHWREILDGLAESRTVTDTFERLGLPMDAYYRYLQRIGRRLRDYHSWRNAHLLHPARGTHGAPVRVYSDVLDVSLRAEREDRRHVLLKFIVSALVADRKIFVLAAHPFFLPERLCPSDRDRRGDVERWEFDQEWASVLHPGATRHPGMAGAERMKQLPPQGRGGYFIRSPYAETAHFLVVQKMLSRFQLLHCYMDGAKEMAASALVAMRGRVLAGVSEQGTGTDGRARPLKRVEIALYQHDKDQRRKVQNPNQPVGERKSLRDAWDEVEQRFEAEAIPKDLLKAAVPHDDPRVRATLFRRAFKGAKSDEDRSLWLDYPQDTQAYRGCRTLWLTRMPGKRVEQHGFPTLKGASLQPVDSIMNSMRARVRSVARPLLRAAGRSYLASYVLPEVVAAELWVYLLRQNYTLRRKTPSRTIPARAVGLVTDAAARLDLVEIAWRFRLGIEHAHRISRWQRR